MSNKAKGYILQALVLAVVFTLYAIAYGVIGACIIIGVGTCLGVLLFYGIKLTDE